MKVMLSAGFDTYSGYGNDAVDMAVWLTKLGVDVTPFPDSILPGLPKMFTDLLTKTPLGDYDVALRFGPPNTIRPDEFAGRGRVAVGWSMWERTPLRRQDMTGWDDADTREAFWGRTDSSLDGRHKDWLDLMVVTCNDNVAAFQALDDKVPYAVVPNGIDPVRWPVLDRPRDRQFTFASIGVLRGRKDPWSTLEAWRLAKQIDPGFDARLVLKTNTAGLHPKITESYPDVEVITTHWTPERVLEFYWEVDCLVSSSHGEGNNKPAMEAMSTGIPVMATNWSGHRNWLHPDTGYPLDGELRETLPGVFDFHVDVEQMAATFLDVWRHREDARRKGALAAQTIRAQLSWEQVLQRLMMSISRVL